MCKISPMGVYMVVHIGTLLYSVGAESEGVNSEGGGGEGVVDKDKINPLLITRRSHRVIKPTKDIDLYLLSAQFGVSLEDSEGEESSDMEFAPAEESDGRPKKIYSASGGGHVLIWSLLVLFLQLVQ